jgi:lysophospholipase L1-like esterase
VPADSSALGSRRRRWLLAIGVLVVAFTVGAVVLVRPISISASADQVTADEVTADLATPEPPASEVPAAMTPTPSSSPTATLTPSPTPTPDATYPPDEIDRAWPKNPPWDACPRPVWPGTPAEGSPGDGRRVLVIGDSLTRESREVMERKLRKSGWTPTFRCWGSKRLDWGLDQLARAKKLGQVPEYVIVALGTNDVSWVDPTTTERRVNTMLDRLGKKRQVLWVDLDVAYSEFSMKRADWFNGMIRKVARSRPNVKVVPWERIARSAKAGRFDGIHYGPSGYRLRGRELTKALNARAAKVDRAAAKAASEATTPAPEPATTATPVPVESSVL